MISFVVNILVYMNKFEFTCIRFMLSLCLLSGMAADVCAAMADNDRPEKKKAVPAMDFLNSMGVCVHIQHGEDASRMAPLLRYIGVRNVRDAADRNYDTSGLIRLHNDAGVKVAICVGSGARDADLPAVLEMARRLHRAGALLAIEGPNEPNNFGGVTYRGRSTAKDNTWMPVAEMQRDLYAAVKADSELCDYPVFGVSETGAQTDNTGLQFIKVPSGTQCLMPEETRFADYLNVHNYMYHPSWQGLADNRVWMAADHTSACRVDGLYGNHGLTWLKKFEGYGVEELATVPRVTTETGVRVGDSNGEVTEHVQACHYMNVYLAQFSRGWKHTFIYEMIDDGDGAFGFFHRDYTTPRLAAHALHNMTTLLADSLSASGGSLAYSLSTETDCVHDLLLRKHDGSFALVVWGERASGSEKVTLRLGRSYAMEVFDPLVGTTPVARREGRSLELEVSDHPLIILMSRHRLK